MIDNSPQSFLSAQALVEGLVFDTKFHDSWLPKDSRSRVSYTVRTCTYVEGITNGHMVINFSQMRGRIRGLEPAVIPMAVLL